MNIVSPTFFLTLFPFQYIQFIVSILIHALLSPLLSVHVGLCVCVHGAPLHVGLLSPSHTSGAGSGTEDPEGPNFPRLYQPLPHLSFPPSVSRPRKCQSGPGQSACCPPAMFHLLSHPLSPTPDPLHSHSHFSLFLFSPFPHLLFASLSVPHFPSAYIYPPCSSPLRPLAGTVNPLHEAVSVCSSAPYVWRRPLDALARSLTAWFGPSVVG